MTFSGRAIIDCVPVSSLKLFATRYGGADKKLMSSALFKLHPEWKSAKLDDNAIDAIWLHKWASHNLARIDTKSAPPS
jgi:hypothetical protein